MKYKIMKLFYLCSTNDVVKNKGRTYINQEPWGKPSQAIRVSSSGKPALTVPVDPRDVLLSGEYSI